MPITVAVPKEVREGEQRVALIPLVAKKLAGLGMDVLVQSGAGLGSRIPDENYREVARLLDDPAALYAQADVVLKVQPPTLAEAAQLKEGTLYIGLLQAHLNLELVQLLRDRRITAFSMELIPRISRAQAMDVLSSQAAVAGYKAVLLAANLMGRFFPMLTTAAGTIRPATTVVIGAGVAGLQAIATAKRLGSQVEAYDVRAAAKEQVQSLGAKFIELEVKAEGSGGYARELTEEEKRLQQEVLARHIAKADVVISTAAVPGRPSPKIITQAMVEGMKPGAVIIDLAAEGGGNCVLTQPGQQITHGNALIYGPLNVPSMLAEHASEMYAKNLQNFLDLIVKQGALNIDWQDQVLAESVVTHDGEIKHGPTRALLEGNPS